MKKKECLVHGGDICEALWQGKGLGLYVERSLKRKVMRAIRELIREHGDEWLPTEEQLRAVVIAQIEGNDLDFDKKIEIPFEVAVFAYRIFEKIFLQKMQKDDSWYCLPRGRYCINKKFMAFVCRVYLYMQKKIDFVTI